jgi:hypothetical protein
LRYVIGGAVLCAAMLAVRFVANMALGMGVCANCGCDIYRTAAGAWLHCYTVSDRCASGKKIMVGHGR